MHVKDVEFDKMFTVILNDDVFRMKAVTEYIDLGPSIKYVSIFEGGGGLKMLTVADMRGRGYLKC